MRCHESAVKEVKEQTVLLLSVLGRVSTLQSQFSHPSSSVAVSVPVLSVRLAPSPRCLKSCLGGHSDHGTLPVEHGELLCEKYVSKDLQPGAAIALNSTKTRLSVDLGVCEI